MSYEVGVIPSQCKVLRQHAQVLRESGHLCMLDDAGNLMVRFAQVREFGERNAPVVTGKDDLREKLYRALHAGIGFTYKSKFRYNGEIRTGWYLVSRVFKKKGWETSLFVKKVVATNRYGSYTGS